MARWKVTAKHYIHATQYGQPTEWERQETNTDTGRLFRKAYKVPMYIDPEDKFCINKHEGICVVARPGSEKPGDILFEGPPTMDMEPLDDEARAETEAEKHKWVDPINSLPAAIGEDFGRSLLEALSAQLDQVGRSPQNLSLRGAPNDEIAQMKAMMVKQQELIDKLLAGQTAPAPEPIEDLPSGPPPVKVDLPKGHTVRRL